MVDVSLDPSNASDELLLEKIKYLGKNIRYSRRRFIAMLPEIDRRRLYRKLGYESTSLMASHEAELSHNVVSKVLKAAEYIRPFRGIKILFERSNIGWSKFVAIASALSRENAADFLWHLKNNTPKSSLEEMARTINEKKKKKQNKTTNIKGAARKGTSTDETSSSNERDTEINSQADLFSGANGDCGDDETNNDCGDDETNNDCGDDETKNDGDDNYDTTSDIDDEDTKGSDNETKDGTCTCTCGCNHRQGVGTVFSVAGKAAINVTLHAHVAEALMQRADKLKRKKSRISDLSKVVEKLLYLDEETKVAKTLPSDKAQLQERTKPSYAKKRNREIHVVTYKDSEDIYSGQTRYGKFEAPAHMVREANAKYGAPIDLNEMRQRAIACAQEFMLSKKALGKELNDHIPRLVKDFIFYRSRGFFCEFPGCNCRGYAFHHLDRKSLNKSCHPDRVAYFCFLHHDLSHNGCIGGEDGPISGLHIDIALGRKLAESESDIARVDALYQMLRDSAVKNKHRFEA